MIGTKFKCQIPTVILICDCIDARIISIHLCLCMVINTVPLHNWHSGYHACMVIKLANQIAQN